MAIVRRELGEIAILDIKGELGPGRVDEVTLHQRIKRELEAGRRRLLINFAEVTFMDSSGVGELLASLVSTQNSGGKLKLEKIPSKIRILFKITWMEGLFEIFDDEDAAIRSFA
jgi:anti-anti-sigma factor